MSYNKNKKSSKCSEILVKNIKKVYLKTEIVQKIKTGNIRVESLKLQTKIETLKSQIF